MTLLRRASLILTPNAIKSGKLYSIVPSNGNGDMTVTRATTATRTNINGIIETIGSNVPRLNYDTVGGCPSILLEPQRTNLLLRSEDFTDNTWLKEGLTPPIINSNNEISPDGTLDASTLIFSGTSGILRQTITKTTSSITYTTSIYLKSNNITNLQLTLQGTTTSNRGIAIINLTNGTISSVSSNGNFTNTSATITPVINGFYRVVLTTTSNTDNVITFRMFSPSVGNIIIWGAQLEASLYVTSYIPTTSSTVTRNADILVRNNIFTNGLITSAGGSWLIDQSFNVLGSGGLEYFLHLNGISINSIGFVLSSSNGTISLRKWTNNVSTLNYTIPNSNRSRSKLMLTFDNTSGILKLFMSGALINTFTSQTFSNYETLALTDANAGGNTQGLHNINSCLLFPTPLTDAECIQLTTL